MAVTGNNYHSQIWESWSSGSATSTTACGVDYNAQDAIWSQWTTTSVPMTSDGTANNYSYTTNVDQELIWINWQEEYQQEFIGGTANVTITTDEQNQVWYNWHDRKVVYVGDTFKEVRQTRRERLKAKRQKIRGDKLAEKTRRKQLFATEVKRRETIAAESKARELLEDLIGEEQMRIYKETGRILVHGDNYDWLISNYQHQGGAKVDNYFELTRNVKIQRIEKDKIVDLCVAHKHDHEKKRIPISDQVIGFLLRVQADEENLKQTANNRGSHDLKLPKKYAIAS